MTNRILVAYNLRMKGLFFFVLTMMNSAFASELKLFAAASLSDSLTAVVKQYEIKHKTKITLVFDASSRLAKQIEMGAAADLYFSADKAWNEFLNANRKISKDMNQDLLSNHLVLIGPIKKYLTVHEMKNLPLLKFKHLALAQENVPAGKYATEALKKLGIYDSLKTRLLTGDNVRNVLRWVAQDEVDLGIVFATDAKASEKVKILNIIDSSLHSKIIYTLTLLNNTSEAQVFFRYCQSDEAQKIFKTHGFDWIAHK